MRELDWATLWALLALAGLVGCAALAAISWIEARRARPRISLFDRRPGEVIFLFDDEKLVDATPVARQLLSATSREGSAWARMTQVLLPKFPGLTEEMTKLADEGEVTVESRDGRARLRGERRDGLARISLVETERDEAAVTVDRHSLTALETELATLRTITDEVPYLTWKEAPDGGIIWANGAYLAASDRLDEGRNRLAWPPRAIFPSVATDGLGRQRHEVTWPDSRQSSWYDVESVRLGEDILRHALPVDAIVQAEQKRSEFVQTLTKTFANLTVGLAIFDRTRRLGLFNPALTDLTGLPASFLIPRPSLQAFVDRLRESRILPEPKNFGTWRQRLSDLERAAANGTFEETWTLPDGRVFQVTGRPHPDGAIAFLIADVSAEMRLTRRFKAELQLNQAVLDTLDEAIAVFAEDGAMALANAAYQRMWNVDPRQAAVQPTLTQAMRLWKTEAPAATDWTALSEALGGARLARPTGFTVERLTGRRLDCRFLPLPGGALMAGFAEVAEAPSPRLTNGTRRQAKSA